MMNEYSLAKLQLFKIYVLRRVTKEEWDDGSVAKVRG